MPARRHEEYRILAKCVAEVARAARADARIHAILEALSELFEPSGASALVVEDKRTLRVLDTHDPIGRGSLQGLLFESWKTEAGAAVQKAEPMYRIMTVDARPGADVPRIKSVLSAPVVCGANVIGVVSLHSPLEGNFDDYEQLLDPYLAMLAREIPPAKASEHESDTYAIISELRSHQVLVLGKDTPPEDKWLVRIGAALRVRGYTPLLVKSFPDFRELSNEEKVRIFADVSGFVVLENSFPAGQIAELKICAVNRIVTAVLRQRGRGSSYMVADYDLDYNYMAEFEYDGNDADLTRAVGAAVDWARGKIEKRARRFDQRYPWRSRGNADRG